MAYIHEALPGQLITLDPDDAVGPFEIGLPDSVENSTMVTVKARVSGRTPVTVVPRGPATVVELADGSTGATSTLYFAAPYSVTYQYNLERDTWNIYASSTPNPLWVTVTSVDSPYTLIPGERIQVNASSGPVVINFTLGVVNGAKNTVKRLDNSVNLVSFPQTEVESDLVINPGSVRSWAYDAANTKWRIDNDYPAQVGPLDVS